MIHLKLHCWPLLLLVVPLLGLAECAPTDEDEDGSSADVDCNDQNPAIYPGAVELCDGLDNDCDRGIDEGFSARTFRDADGDGFGDDFQVSCDAETGYVPVRGDCSDIDDTVYPGAADPAEDGLDQDCGGSDGPQPHFGYPGSRFESLQAAVDAASQNDVIWVGPGTWTVLDLHLNGSPLTLISSHDAALTILDARMQGRVLRVEAGEDATTLIDGFTLTGGQLVDENGAGLLVRDSSPTLMRLSVRDNVTSSLDTLEMPDGGVGGGIALENSTSTLQQLLVENNQSIQSTIQLCQPSCSRYYAGGRGAGIFIRGGAPLLQHVELIGNRALPMPGVTDDDGISTRGGGLHIRESSATLRYVQARQNEAYRGGGLYGEESTLLIEDSSSNDNSGQEILQGGIGGALVVTKSVLTLRRFEARSNARAYPGGVIIGSSDGVLEDLILVGNDSGMGGGGGLMVDGVRTVPVEVRRALIANNRADSGGGVRIAASEVHFEQVTVAHNVGRGGGGFDIDQCHLVMKNSLVTHNQGPNVYVFPNIPCTAEIESTSIYSPSGPNQNMTDVGIEQTWLEIDPQYVRASNDLNPDNDDLHLSPDSPLRDAGSLGTTDPDGSPAELGTYGGPQGDSAYYSDSDADGLYDGWELSFWSGLTMTHADSDPDEDGLSNLTELQLGLDPTATDSDGDGLSDGAERDAASDPLDWYRRPIGAPGADVSGQVFARVPGDFPTIQDAINAIVTNGEIVLAAGHFKENLRVAGKDVHLSGAGDAADTVIEARVAESVFLGAWGRYTLEHLTFKGGKSSVYGGCIDLHAADSVLSHLLVERCLSDSGGGISATEGSFVLENSIVRHNTASYRGGGVNAEAPYTRISGSRIEGNTAGWGGGICNGSYVSFLVENSQLVSNHATQSGGGMRIEHSPVERENPLRLQNVLFEENSTNGSGAGFVVTILAEASHLLLRNNHAEEAGGAIYQYQGSTLTLAHTVAVNNRSGTGSGGLFVYGAADTALTLKNSVLAYNEGYNLERHYNEGDLPPVVILSSVVLYNPASTLNHTLPPSTPGLRTVEPGFLRYVDTAGMSCSPEISPDCSPSDAHLSLGSPLVNTVTLMEFDEDGSRADIGMYGGGSGADWDRDRDGIPDWFWPGSPSDAPEGFQPTDFDSNDEDSTEE